MITSASDLFEEWLGSIKYSADSTAGKSYPFFVRVGCVKMAAPRHGRFQYILNLGYTDIDRIFSGAPFKKSELTFVFPERYMGVHEQRGFMDTLTKHPDVVSIKTVDIITSSPLILGDFYKEQIRIITWDDDAKHNGNPNFGKVKIEKAV